MLPVFVLPSTKRSCSVILLAWTGRVARRAVASPSGRRSAARVSTFQFPLPPSVHCVYHCITPLATRRRRPDGSIPFPFLIPFAVGESSTLVRKDQLVSPYSDSLRGAIVGIEVLREERGAQGVARRRHHVQEKGYVAKYFTNKKAPG